MQVLSSKFMMFGEDFQVVWQKIPVGNTTTLRYVCQHNQFYLNIPDIAQFLAFPETNSIIIEKANPEMADHILHTWLLGTVVAYILQYHDYLVLHGSAVIMNDKAVIFSGQSGAGKSTLASALVQKGYPFITDNLVVIKRNHQGQYCILPGPAKIKLWSNAIQHFNHDMNDALPVSFKVDKYAIPVSSSIDTDLIPIAAFYELNVIQQTKQPHCERLDLTHSLKTLMQNAYRYFMLKPLGKLQPFFQDCSVLSRQIDVHKLTRTPHFHDLPDMIKCIEFNQGIKT